MQQPELETVSWRHITKLGDEIPAFSENPNVDVECTLAFAIEAILRRPFNHLYTEGTRLENLP